MVEHLQYILGIFTLFISINNSFLKIIKTSIISIEPNASLNPSIFRMSVTFVVWFALFSVSDLFFIMQEYFSPLLDAGESFYPTFSLSPFIPAILYDTCDSHTICSKVRHVFWTNFVMEKWAIYRALLVKLELVNSKFWVKNQSNCWFLEGWVFICLTIIYLGGGQQWNILGSEIKIVGSCIG